MNEIDCVKTTPNLLCKRFLWNVKWASENYFLTSKKCLCHSSAKVLTLILLPTRYYMIISKKFIYYLENIRIYDRILEK